MCQFISWEEYKNEILFLTKKELGTNRGKALKKHLGSQYENDIKGHGAIEWYYKIKPRSGIHRECEDFSTPENFPPVIVKAIKMGLFEGIGIAEEILTKPALAQYKKVEGPAFWKIAKIKKNRIKTWR